MPLLNAFKCLNASWMSYSCFVLALCIQYIIIYMHTHIHTYIHTYIHTGLIIDGFASPNANHFWGKSVSLCQLIRNIFGSLLISVGRLRITFANGFTKRLFLSSLLIREVLCNKEQK